MSNPLPQYLNEFRAELQELYTDFDHAIANEDNHDLHVEAYGNVGKQLEEAIESLDSLIADIENGVYDKNLEIPDLDEDN